MKKQASGADLEVAVDPSSSGKVVTKSYDPNKGHPFNATVLLEKVNSKRVEGRKLSTYDRDAAISFSKLKEQPKYAWKHDTSPSYVYSHEAVSFLAKQKDAYFDDARARYGHRNIRS